MKMEFQIDNVYVTVIYPGFVRTSIAMNSLMGDIYFLVVEDLTTRKVIKLEDFAKKMFGSVEQKMGGFFWW